MGKSLKTINLKREAREKSFAKLSENELQMEISSRLKLQKQLLKEMVQKASHESILKSMPQNLPLDIKTRLIISTEMVQ